MRTKEVFRKFPCGEEASGNPGFAYPAVLFPMPLPQPHPRAFSAAAVVAGVHLTEVAADSGWLFLSGFRLISLKILNSIVLLGKSCQYVKEAKMEEKLFNPPPASAPGKPSSKSQSKSKSSQGKFGSFFITSVNCYLKN